MGKTVSPVDSSASWVDVSRCEIKSSYNYLLLTLFDFSYKILSYNKKKREYAC